MLRIIILLTAMTLVFASQSWGMTKFCGVIDKPMSFMRSASPYLIEGDVVIMPTGRLTIESGVEVIIAPKDTCPRKVEKENGKEFFLTYYDYNDSMFVGFKSQGSFYVNGTPQNPVIIRAQDTTNSFKVHWDGIRIVGGDPTITQIQNLRISGANRAIEVTRSEFSIANTLFEHNNAGIYLKTNGNINIFNNVFSKNFNAGLIIDNAAPSVYSNIFVDNLGYGIWSDKKAAARIKNNNFWQNQEFHCYRCPWQVGKITKLNHNGDSTDIENNLFKDPLFVGSEGAKLFEFKDLDLKTPASQVIDTHIMELEAKARAKQDDQGLKAKDDFIPRGPSIKAPFLLSKYSPLIGAGPDHYFLLNDDSSRNDIGLWGATPDLVKKPFPMK